MSNFRISYTIQTSNFLFTTFLASLDFHLLEETVQYKIIKKINYQEPVRFIFDPQKQRPNWEFWFLENELTSETSMNIYTEWYTYVYMYEYICVYICMYTHIYTYTHTHRGIHIVINKQWRQVSMKTSLRFWPTPQHWYCIKKRL